MGLPQHRLRRPLRCVEVQDAASAMAVHASALAPLRRRRLGMTDRENGGGRNAERGESFEHSPASENVQVGHGLRICRE